MKLPTLWETVGTDSEIVTKRLRVVGGWLVHIRNTTSGNSDTTFVSDPGFDWELSNTDA